jgi:hypothetical protein
LQYLARFIGQVGFFRDRDGEDLPGGAAGAGNRRTRAAGNSREPINLAPQDCIEARARNNEAEQAHHPGLDDTARQRPGPGAEGNTDWLPG